MIFRVCFITSSFWKFRQKHRVEQSRKENLLVLIWTWLPIVSPLIFFCWLLHSYISRQNSSQQLVLLWRSKCICLVLNVYMEMSLNFQMHLRYSFSFLRLIISYTTLFKLLFHNFYREVPDWLGQSLGYRSSIKEKKAVTFLLTKNLWRLLVFDPLVL